MLKKKEKLKIILRITCQMTKNGKTAQMQEMLSQF